MSRALRRHHRDRMRARARRSFMVAAIDEVERREHWLVRLAENLKCCSCWGCGNARRRDGATVQERRGEAAAREETA